MITILGTLTGMLLAATALSPLYARRSADAYEGFTKDGIIHRKRWLIIFTKRQPNRLMQREKTRKPVDQIGILPPGLKFYGETALGQKDSKAKNRELPGYWEIKASDDPYEDSPSKIHKFRLIRAWVRYINLFVDVGLVGVRGYYDLPEYPIEKTRLVKVVDGDRTKYKIEPPRIDEKSNHVRTAPFLWIVPVIGAETKDRVPWDIIVLVNVKCTNPWLARNNHENWPQFLTSAVTDAVVRGLRGLNTEDVIGLTLSAGGDEGKDAIVVAIKHIDKRLKSVIGYCFDESAGVEDTDYSGGVQILSIEPHFENDSDKLAFRELWRATQKKEATIVLSEGDAKREVNLGKAEAKRESGVLRAIAIAMAERPKFAEIIQRYQAIENASKGGSTIIFDSASSGGDSDRKLLAAILKELKKGGGK